jgi:hypothetical protein
VFTARYALSPYTRQLCFVFKGLNQHNPKMCVYTHMHTQSRKWYKNKLVSKRDTSYLHGGTYNEHCFQVCKAVPCGRNFPTFLKNLLPPSSGS